MGPKTCIQVTVKAPSRSVMDLVPVIMVVVVVVVVVSAHLSPSVWVLKHAYRPHE